MRRSVRRARRFNRRIRRGLRRPLRRRGNLLGIIGLTALGVTLLDKHQREQQRNQPGNFIDQEFHDQ